MLIEAKVRRVGSSLGVLLPKKVLDERGIKEGDTVVIPTVAPRSTRDLFGVWRGNPVRTEFEEET